MAKAVLTVKAQSAYDDLPETRYHFPKTYLNQVREAVGDWIVYYEPRRPGAADTLGGRRSYFATARITELQRDPASPDHYYALIADYVEFDTDVPFSNEGAYPESALRKEDGTTNRGVFGRSVRILPDHEYELICFEGFARARAALSSEPAPQGTMENVVSGFNEDQQPFVYEAERRIVESVQHRPLRDAAFRERITSAYDNRCAFTGLSITNGGGRAEVQAAHIRPVADGGPDSVRNGIALSQTIHWMFDRGLLAVNDDYSLATSSSLPDQAARLLNQDGMVLRPDKLHLSPHPIFLRYHREHIFKP